MMYLAMDLSMNSPAFAVLKLLNGRLSVVDLSSIKQNTKKSHGYRLFVTYNHIQELFKTYPIQEVVSEKGFSRHANTTQVLYMVHGVARVAAYQNGLEVHEITPTTVKKHVAGSGKASKEQVADGVRGFFKEELFFKNDDESDAVGVGVAHLVEKGRLK
ncbi:crossover junction endodeoxyribonuclease RuvC [Alkalicoccobacillus gibsonii]|uniref:crossover junction endodeoxyribonuclease RuvC n=1 Tax=Alkalicoccobacillus gibsonii TaxID=79881 RepID=UPI0035143B43